MPYKRKTKQKRKGRRRRRKSYVSQSLAPIAQSQVVKMKYGDFVSLDAGAGTAVTHTFSANNIYDPNITGGGHQPLGRDEWAMFYNHYCVVGSKIKVTFIPTVATALTGGALCSISCEDDSTVTATATTTCLERAGVAWTTIGNTNAANGRSLRKTFSAKRFFGVSNIKDNYDRLGGAIGGNPAEQAYYHVSAAPLDNSSNPSPIIAIVEIEYLVLLTERKNLLQS